MLKILNRFITGQSGAYAMITALTLPALLGVSALAVDYSLIAMQKQRLQSAANSAALAAATEVNIAYRNSENVDYIKVMEETAEAVFRRELDNINLYNMDAFVVNAHAEKSAINVEISVRGRYETQLMRFAGYDEVNISTAAHASFAPNKYINFSYLFDVSHSMGIGATLEDQIKMDELIGCAFACHVDDDSRPDTYSYLRDNSDVTMRVDVAREAAMESMDILKANVQTEKQFTVGAYVYDNIVYEVSNHASSRAHDFDYLKTVLDEKVHLQRKGGGSNTAYALEELSKKLPQSGNGNTPDTRKQVVVVFSDAVENTQAWHIMGTGRGTWIRHGNSRPNWPFGYFSYFQRIHALKENACDRFHSKNIEVYFIYTQALEPYGAVDWLDVARFDFIKNKLFDILPARMLSCTRDEEKLISVSAPEEILSAFRKIVSSTAKPLHLR